MWICSRCQTANKDGYNQCVQCSAPRNARRFGAGTPVDAPRVHSAAQSPAPRPDIQAPPPARPVQQPSHEAQPAQSAALGFVRLIGLLLSLLLPSLVILFAVVRLDALMPVIRQLFFKPATAIPPVFEYAVYGFCAFVAALISLVPGLMLWAMGSIVKNSRL